MVTYPRLVRERWGADIAYRLDLGPDHRPPNKPRIVEVYLRKGSGPLKHHELVDLQTALRRTLAVARYERARHSKAQALQCLPGNDWGHLGYSFLTSDSFQRIPINERAALIGAISHVAVAFDGRDDLSPHVISEDDLRHWLRGQNLGAGASRTVMRAVGLLTAFSGQARRRSMPIAAVGMSRQSFQNLPPKRTMRKKHV